MLGASYIGTEAVTSKPKGRQQRRNPWTAMLAVVLGMLAGGTSALGVSSSLSGSTSVSEQTTDARSASRPVSVRFDVNDPSIGFGGDDDTPFALRKADGFPSHPSYCNSIRPHAFGLPVVVALVRDGLTRAPPLA